MPWMERLTWNGIALHAGDLPGYPASHGCVRLPLEFSKLLFTVTTKGGTVIIADEHSAPRETADPGMIFSQATPPAADASLSQGEFSWTPEKSDHGPVTILFTAADKQVYGSQWHKSVARPLRGVSGMHVYSAPDGADAEGRRKWVRGWRTRREDPSFTELATGAGIPAAFVSSVRSVVQPGTTLVLTDKPVNGETQSKPGFKILAWARCRC
jgi:hypothetical protein